MAAGVTRVGGFPYLRARAIRVTMAGGLTLSHVNTPGRLGLIRLPELAFYLFLDPLSVSQVVAAKLFLHFGISTLMTLFMFHIKDSARLSKSPF